MMRRQVSPTHAELQAQATTALDTALDHKTLGLAIKPAAGETFDHAEPAVQTVEHPLDKSICDPFLQMPEANLITFANPPSVDRSEVLCRDPLRVANAVGKTASGKASLCSPHPVLRSQTPPVDKAVPTQFLLACLVLSIQAALVNQATAEQHLFDPAVV